MVGYVHKHFEISGHAFDRFNERTGHHPFEMMEWLDNAVLFVPNRQSTFRQRRVCERASQRGHYALECNGVLFTIDPSTKERHVVTTCITC